MVGETYIEQKLPNQSNLIKELLDFLNTAVSPYNAVAAASNLLIQGGFTRLSEKNPWKLQKGQKYFFTRNQSTIVAFSIGQKFNEQEGDGFAIIGAHTDSPTLKVKPQPQSKKSGFDMLNVETYGGGLWHTWFDRDLSLAGRVLIKQKNGMIQQKQIKIEKPILRIPMLAIHLNRTINTDGFKPNSQDHLQPILTYQIKNDLSKVEGESGDQNQSIALNKILADNLGDCEPKDIVDFELDVYDTQKSQLGGINDEFVLSARLDNLCSSFTTLRALIDSGDLADESSIRMAVLFDHEEVGSGSQQGACSPFLKDAISRILNDQAQQSKTTMDFQEIYVRSLQNSFLVSADMAHAQHPNYPEKHDSNHAPKFGQGLVIKHNKNQRYATNSVTATIFRQAGQEFPVQDFAVRNDMGCGSTIGPLLAQNIGIRVVDVGVAQLAMHSIREMCASKDVEIAYGHFKSFYEKYSEVNKLFQIDDL